MSDPRLCKLAQVLVRYCVNPRPGERVGIAPIGSIATALSLQAEVVREVLKSGGLPQPYVILGLADEFDYVLFSTANDAQLEQRDRIFELVAREFDCDIRILCETNTRRLSRLDPERQVLALRTHSDLIRLYHERAAKGELRWVLTAFPTLAYAQDAEMSLEESAALQGIEEELARARSGRDAAAAKAQALESLLATSERDRETAQREAAAAHENGATLEALLGDLDRERESLRTHARQDIAAALERVRRVAERAEALATSLAAAAAHRASQ